MALMPMPQEEYTEYTASQVGITGTTAKKSGRVVTLNFDTTDAIDMTSSQLTTFGTLSPAELRPKERMFCAIINDYTNESSKAMAYIYIQTNGVIQIYGYPGVEKVKPRGVITYIV